MALVLSVRLVLSQELVFRRLQQLWTVLRPLKNITCQLLPTAVLNIQEILLKQLPLEPMYVCSEATSQDVRKALEKQNFTREENIRFIVVWVHLRPWIEEAEIDISRRTQKNLCLKALRAV